MSGWIGSSFAVVPFGAGTPATATAPPVAPDLTATYIDPRTRDYTTQTDGELSRMPRVRQQMLIALTTVVESMSVNTEFGIKLPGKIDATFQRRMDVAVRLACKHIVDALITAVDVIVAATGRVVTTVSYTDLTTGTSEQVSN